MDVTLKERAQANKARREEMLIEIARLRQRKEMPLSRFGSKQIPTFCSVLKEKFRDQTINFGKEYLKLRPLQNPPFCPIPASGSNFNPRNIQCIPVVKIFPFLELEQK